MPASYRFFPRKNGMTPFLRRGITGIQNLISAGGESPQSSAPGTQFALTADCVRMRRQARMQLGWLEGGDSRAPEDHVGDLFSMSYENLAATSTKRSKARIGHRTASMEVRLTPKAKATASAAVISSDGKYRYKLSRRWAWGSNRSVWIMLNPSTADAVEDDATIRRCISFAKRWGCDGIDVYNLFALRSRHPFRIEKVNDPVGPDNDHWLSVAAHTRGKVIAAWGACNTPVQMRRANEVVQFLLRDRRVLLSTLGLTKSGQPRHPLYVRNDAPLIPLDRR